MIIMLQLLLLEGFMSNLIATDAQQNELDPFIELFEVQLSTTVTLYLHPGVAEGLTSIQCRDYNSPYTVRTYLPLPMMIRGIELNSDGAQNRPTLTIANVAATFRDLLGLEGLTNDSLIGKRIIRRQTLKKYLYGESGDASPPVEFPRKVYVIDRISGENNIAVSFDLASPYDVTGINIPNRVVVGKYCSWRYQNGGCMWPSDSTIYYKNTAGAAISHKVYFTSEDEPIVPLASVSGAYSSGTTYSKSVIVSYLSNYWISESDSNLAHTPSASSIYWSKVRVYTVWSSSSVVYTANSVDPFASDYVEHNSTIWRVSRTHTSQLSKEPEVGSIYWVRGDVCSKTLTGCKCRFQFVPKNIDTANSTPSVDLDTSKQLPFGGFPGTSKFK